MASMPAMRPLCHHPQHHPVGIRPGLPVTQSFAGGRERLDELLERTLEIVPGG